MTTAEASTSNREELMFLGKECHHPSCHLNDFLPFSCPACKLSFCQPHFLPSHHACTSPLPKSMQDRIAPQCPLCNTVVNSVPNGDPNEAVERHLGTGTCVGLEGGEARRKALLAQKKEKGEVCWRKGCAKTLVVKIRCDSCRHMFCPTHRTTASHSCNDASASPSRGTTPQPISATSTTKNPISRLASKPSQPISKAGTSPAPPTPPVQPISAQLDAKSAAATAALRRAGQDVKAPFIKSKTTKRTKDEQNSAMQALKVRHDKGLLSKDEEVKYADMLGKNESSRRKGEGKKDCVIA